MRAFFYVVFSQEVFADPNIYKWYHERVDIFSLNGSHASLLDNRLVYVRFISIFLHQLVGEMIRSPS